MEFQLPSDLASFLEQGYQLQYDPKQAEPERLTLVPLGEHVVGEVYVDSENHPYADTDPHVGQYGYYTVPAVNLIASTEHYDPESLLLWLPEWNLYGSWNIDDWTLFVFPNAVWQHIVSNPVPYINVQWKPDEVKHENFMPWLAYPHKYVFKQGRPWD